MKQWKFFGVLQMNERGAKVGKGKSDEKCAQQLRATAPAPGQGRCEKIQNLTARTTENPVSKFKAFTCVSLSCRRGLACV